MMKSNDIEKVETILNKIKYLNVDIRYLLQAKREGINDSCIRINHRFYEIDEDLVQIVLEKFNSEMNGYIEELKQLGVEYVNETD